MVAEKQGSTDAAAKQKSLKEKQLYEMRKMRKDTDSQHQAMLNRISFLRSEESKLDKDIENAKRKALELLSRKAVKAEKLHDDDLASTAKDILGAVGQMPASKPLRPTTGRSSLQSSMELRAGISTAADDTCAASTSPSRAAAPDASTTSGRLRSASAQRPPRTSPSSLPLKPTLSSSAGAKRVPSNAAQPSLELTYRSAAGTPPLAPSSSRKQVKPSTQQSVDGGTASTSSAALGTGAAAGRPPVHSSSNSMQLLGSSGLGQQQQQQDNRLNKMDTLPGGSGSGTIDMEFIEELIAGTSSAQQQGRPS